MINGIDSYNNYANYMKTPMARSSPNPEEMFNNVDNDGSGGISRSELMSFVQNLSNGTGNTIGATDGVFSFDSDGDGELSNEEFMSFMEATIAPPGGMMGVGGGPPPGQGDLFQALDTDSSIGVSQSELDEWAEAMADETGNSVDTSDAVSTYDVDGDGELSEDELKSFMEASGIRPPPPPPGSAGMMGEADSSESSSDTTADSVISMYDTNNDGVLSSDELQAYLDDTDTASINNLMQQALNAYGMNFGNNRSSDPEEAFLEIIGLNGYSPVDLSA